ncbi:MAG TPA: cation diffusion facilitator family transporter [Rhodocyclaceae bacterium]|nr:cation transporter [Rhodocyclaceae bacterium]HNB80328.1 cation diffusion facilitator family transporter [Rhodocyclaceae bacterium]
MASHSASGSPHHGHAHHDGEGHGHAGHAHHAHHAHEGHGHAHDHHPAGAPRRALGLALAITLGFAAVEAVAGWMAGSLALLSDAGHMVTDALSLGVALLAAAVALRPPSARLSYGYARIEVLAALFNAGFMFAVILMIGWQAAERLRAPQPVDGATVIWIGALGLAINLLVAWILSRDGDAAHNLNTRGALLHVLGDALGSVAALASGLVIRQTGWTPIDPILSFGICALIAGSTWRLAREAIHTLMEGVPAGLSTPAIGRRMAAVAGVLEVHDLHIWSMDARRPALSAHVRVADLADWPRQLDELRRLLAREFAIEHVTLQPEAQQHVTVLLRDIAGRRSLH